MAAKNIINAGDQVSWKSEGGSILTGKFLGEDEFGFAAVRWTYNWVVSVPQNALIASDEISLTKKNNF